MMPWLIFRRDVLIAFRRGGGTFATLAFSVMVFSIFAFGLGPEQLRGVAPGVLTVTILLSCLLALPNLFERDHEDGTLEQYLVQPVAMEWLTLAKLLACWCTAALPLILVSPLLGLMAGMDIKSAAQLILALLLASPSLIAVGALGAALTLGARRGFAQALILLPLYIPVLVFTATAGEREGATLMLAGMALIALPLSCFLSAVVLRLAQE